MNHLTQLDSHPEAESLNAFAEDALPSQERQQVLAHLTTCSHCRQIVFLATDAANEAPISQPDPALQTKVNRSPWFTNWSILWAIGAACAAILTIAIILPQIRRSPDRQVARMTSTWNRDTSARASERSRNSVPTTQPAQSKMAVAPAPPISAKPARISKMAILPIAPTQPIVQPPHDADATIASPTAGVARTSAIAPRAFDANAAPVPAMPLPGVNPESSAQPSTSVALTPSPTVSVAQFPGSGSPILKLPESRGARSFTPPAARSFAKRTVGGASSAFQIHSASTAMPSGQSITINGPLHFDSPTLDTDAARRILYSRLPNGSTAVSTAAAQHHLLAIDAQGSLFRSEDYGVTWEAVTQQWTGRALQVHINPAPAMSPNAVVSVTPCRTCAANQPTTSTAAPIFEILTDSVSKWISTDGKTWKAK